LVSAFLAERQLSAQLLRQARQGAFLLCLSHEILNETQQTLLTSVHIRERYAYPDEKVYDFTQGLRAVARIRRRVPRVTGASRDPRDDMVIACALASRAPYLVTRDKDLLDLKTYRGLEMITPEAFMGVLRKQSEP
jgi:putative PIN family toxin of toxin-antitoxin system